MLPDPIFLNIHMYGVMVALGILAACLVLFKYSKAVGLDPKFTDLMYYDGIFSVLIGFGSSSLFQSLYDYIENPSGGFHFGKDITFIGGLIGGLAVFFIIWLIFRKKYKESIRNFLPVLPCCVLIAHGFGRIGCFFAGCCYGVRTDSFLGVKFPNLPYPVLPTQLFEAAFLLIMFGVCSYLLLKKHFDRTLPLYLVSYGVFRFIIEFYRDDHRGAFVGSISPSQFWSIVMVVIGSLLFIFYKKILPKAPVPASEIPANETPVNETHADENEK